MILWKDIGITEFDDCEKKAKELAEHYAGRVAQFQSEDSEGKGIDKSSFINNILNNYNDFFEKTKEVLIWSDVPQEKHRFDYERQQYTFFYGRHPLMGMSVEKIDKVLEQIGVVGKLELDKKFAFFHSLESAVMFAEEQRFTQSEASVFLSALLESKSFYNPLYIREVLNHSERFGFKNKEGVKQFAEEINVNYGKQKVDLEKNDIEIQSISNEAERAQQFFKTRAEKNKLHHKFVIHAIDGQVCNRTWRTYPQIAERTANTLASIAMYGIVAGGVRGGIVPTALFGSIDKADMRLFNWYPQYQGAVFVPLERFVQPNFQCKFVGNDVVLGPNEEKVLPYIEPEKFITIIPKELSKDVSQGIKSIGDLLRKPEEEVKETLNRCLIYNPQHWKDFHYFNEWLQLTAEGNSLLEEKLGVKVVELRTVDDVNKKLDKGYLKW